MGPTYPLHTPFNSNAITGDSHGIIYVNGVPQSTLPKLYNATNPSGTLVENTTTNVINSTSAGGLGGALGFISNSFFFGLAILWGFIQFLTGGFAFALLGLFGFPAIFIYSMQAVYGFVLVRSFIYFVLGR